MTPDFKLVLKQVALDSDDPDTQTACFIVNPGQVAIAFSANVIPDGVEKLPQRLQRPDKYTYIAHAERNAISRAARAGESTDFGTMYLNWFPCADCANAIVAAGIKTLYADGPAYEARKSDPRYKFAESMAILTEGGVDVQFFQ